MKKSIITALFIVLFISVSAPKASALVNDTVKVGLRYGSSVMFSANLENSVGAGYQFGFFNDDRSFTQVGSTDDTTISMTGSGVIYIGNTGTYSESEPSTGGTRLGDWRIQFGPFANADEAQASAVFFGGWHAWIGQQDMVRLGCYDSAEEAVASLSSLREQYPEIAALEEIGIVFSTVQCSNSGVTVTKTKTSQILFEFDYSGTYPLGVLPVSTEGEAVTWFRGYKYPGAFEYPRSSSGLSVINVVPIESYVKGVIPYEMSPNWPIEALKAQAICARTYASRTTKHLKTYGFDICNTTDCQVYYGYGTGSRSNSALSDQAVDETAGVCMYYDGKLIDAVYSSSDGGATEDAANVWGSAVPYLIGKEDPYEALVIIPSYRYSVTYTAKELTNILNSKGYGVGTVKNVYVSEWTSVGNVRRLTFVGTEGTRVISGSLCRTIFYSSTYDKSVRSIRYTITGNSGSGSAGMSASINTANEVRTTLDGLSVITGSGKTTQLSGSSFVVLSSSGKSTLSMSDPSDQATYSSFTIDGAGSGHNVGMSQYGAKAMAEMGMTCDDILDFYYTNITIR